MKKNIRYELQYLSKISGQWKHSMTIYTDENMKFSKDIVDEFPDRHRIIELHHTVIYPKPKVRKK